VRGTPPRTAARRAARMRQRRGPASRSLAAPAALGRALREDGWEEGMQFHVRCARVGGMPVGVLKVDGSTFGKFAGTISC
jgi:hypothetical protein